MFDEAVLCFAVFPLSWDGKGVLITSQGCCKTWLRSCEHHWLCPPKDLAGTVQMAEGVGSCGGLLKEARIFYLRACKQLLLLLLLWEGTNLMFCSAGYDEQLCCSGRFCQLPVGTLLGRLWNTGETSLTKTSLHPSANNACISLSLGTASSSGCERGRGWASTVPYLKEMWVLLGLETEVIFQ